MTGERRLASMGFVSGNRLIEIDKEKYTSIQHKSYQEVMAKDNIKKMKVMYQYISPFTE
jgi:hypothetical protein